MELNYSVVIRTLGLAGDKYRRLLNSIDKQTIKPSEILVVLADGYELPPEQLGYERFIFSKKGIVSQRSLGAKEARSEYCLFLDDDLDFESTTVEKLFLPIKQGLADVTFPILTEMLPNSFLGCISSCLTMSAVPMIINKRNQYIRILRTGGWSYNRKINESNINYYYAESAPGACFLVSKKKAVSIRFEEECWLEKTSFSLPDDQIMFYKYYKLGHQIVGVSNIHMIHLDGGNNSPGRDLKASYSLGKHKVIFWHRFIFKNDRFLLSKIFSLFCFLYWIISSVMVGFLTAILKFRFNRYWKHLSGFIDGFKFLNTKEYRDLPIVKKNNYL
jgi:glycosyltransferase involved in cell wall biosynthesis